MTHRIKIAASDLDELRRLVIEAHPFEGAAFALAGVAELGHVTDVLVRRVVPIPKWAFGVQDEDHLRLDPVAINGLVSLCEANGLGAVLCHSHPFPASYSPADDVGERRVARVLHQCLPAPVPVASLLFTPEGIEGRVWRRDAEHPIPADEILILGDHLRRHAQEMEMLAVDPQPVYDRQIRAFGEEGQARIAASKVAVVGTGGTGSPIAEQLGRLGVRDILLIDPDTLEPSNLTRVYGTFADVLDGSSVGRKVELVARHLRRINPEARVRAIAGNVAYDEVARELLDRDCIFLCTDDHWGRSVVNQLAYQYLVPVINVGVRIAAKGGRIEGATGVIDVLRPDLPCLWCKGFLDPARIAAESQPEQDHQTLRQEGYVEGLESGQPAVVGMTTTMAGHAVSLFLHLITGFMGPGGNVQRLNWDVMTAEMRRGRTPISDGCICQKIKGRGDLAVRPTLVGG